LIVQTQLVDQLTFAAGIDELAGVQALRSSNQGIDALESVRVLELNSGDGSTTARVMYNVSHNTFDVALSLGEVSALVAHRALAKVGVGLEDGSLALSLGSDNLSHLILPFFSFVCSSKNNTHAEFHSPTETHAHTHRHIQNLTHKQQNTHTQKLEWLSINFAAAGRRPTGQKLKNESTRGLSV
jgi:hypothetical protein